ncbi:MAG: hypothetical protein H6709_19300 [Kofleriaceae bacterium]|nr:hypothetical protein [Kofleriaceae bacterium]MCB9574238.1 hypothetical protein [Kofleriaceae bacterium]
MTAPRTSRTTRITRWLVSGVVVLALARVQASRAAPDDVVDPAVIELLSAFDYVPTRAALDDVMGPAPIDQLRQLIGLDLPVEMIETDPGVQLRAVRALARYPGDDARTTLRDTLARYAFARHGHDLLLLRAALESLAVVGGAAAVPDITPFLDVEESRDLRAAAANALRVIKSATALPALRARQLIETEPQVSFAITEALRAILEG